MPDYARRVRRVLTTVLVLNATVAVAKLVAGWRANSLSVLGDGLHSALDAAANFAALVVLRLATAPPDEDHPFGHSKYETLAAFVLSGMLLLTAFELATAAVGRIMSPVASRITAVTVVVMLATLVVNVGVAAYERREGRALGSDILVADAAQTHGDVFVTLSVLVGLGLQAVGIWWADAAFALLVAGVIAYVAYGVFKDAAPILTDRVLFEPATVARIVTEVPGVLNVHDIRSRGTPRESFLQMHLVVDAHDVQTAHDITDEVERRLENELGVKEVVIHVEPFDDASGPPGSSPSL